MGYDSEPIKIDLPEVKINININIDGNTNIYTNSDNEVLFIRLYHKEYSIFKDESKSYNYYVGDWNLVFLKHGDYYYYAKDNQSPLQSSNANVSSSVQNYQILKLNINTHNNIVQAFFKYNKDIVNSILNKLFENFEDDALGISRNNYIYDRDKCENDLPF